MKVFLNIIKYSGSCYSESPVKSSNYNSDTTICHPGIKANSTMRIYIVGIRPFLQDFYTYEAFIHILLGLIPYLLFPSHFPTIPSLLYWPSLLLIFLPNPKRGRQPSKNEITTNVPDENMQKEDPYKLLIECKIFVSTNGISVEVSQKN